MTAHAAVEAPVHFREPQIEMAHGAGGKASRRLVEGLFAPLLFGASAEILGDATHLNLNGSSLAITADSFVVKPLSFPGGSIGELAVNGTVNDLAVSGARAEALVCHLHSRSGLAHRCAAWPRFAPWPMQLAGPACRVVGGDTKVVEHGKADGMYITTTGVGRPLRGVKIDPRTVRPGDKVLLSGPIGDHGITILLARGELDFEAELRSDTRSVLSLVEALALRSWSGHSLDARSHARRRCDLSQ